MCGILYLTRKKQVAGDGRWSEEGSALSVPENLTDIKQRDDNQHFTRDGVSCAAACIKGEITN